MIFTPVLQWAVIHGVIDLPQGSSDSAASFQPEPSAGQRPRRSCPAKSSAVPVIVGAALHAL
jgi:hypothetical protein